MKEDTEVRKGSQHSSSDEQDTGVSQGRRAAVTKLAYASPVIAGILFSQRATVQAGSHPPPPPPGPGTTN